MRGLQELQARHPDIVVVALNTVDDPDATSKILQQHKLDALRVAPAKEWQDKLGLSEAIPVTVVVDHGRVRVIHDSVLPDPVAYLEADLAALGSAISGGAK